MFNRKQKASQDTERLFRPKKETRFSRLRKKKWFWPVVVLLIVLLCAFLIFSVRGRQLRGMAAQTNAQSSTVTRGDVSTTISGTGTLENSAGTDVNLYNGLEITDVLVSAGDTVTKGQTLATVKKASAAELLLEVNDAIDDKQDELDDLDSDEDLKQVVLEAELTDLKTARSTLQAIYKSGTITASRAGVISAVNISAGDTVGQSSATSGTDSSAATSSDAAAAAAQQFQTAARQNTATVRLLDTEENTEETVTTISALGDLSVTAPKAGETPQSTVTSTDAYSAAISWDCSGAFEAGQSYTATITLTAADGYAFGEANSYQVALDGAKTTEITVDNAGQAGNRLTITATYQTAAAGTGQTPGGSGSTGSSSGSKGTTSGSGNTGSITIPSGSAAVSSGQASAGVSGNSASISSAAAASSGTDSTTDAQFPQTSAFTLSSDDQVVIQISVDELDINSVSTGETATVTLDALEGQEFAGTVSKVGATAVTSSGSSKYTVEITLTKADGMLAGMSASAVINIAEAKNVLTIPVDAVQERGDTSYVYTKQDANGNLSGEVEIETGLSNGTQVEVTSGLSEGDTVYYTVAGSDSSTDAMTPGGFAADGNMPDNGDNSGDNGGMPSGGPQGGGPGE